MQNMDTYLPTLFAKRKGVAIEEINKKKNQFKKLFHNIMNVHGDKRFVEAWPNTWKQLIDLIPIADFQKKYEWKRTRRGSVEIKEDTGGFDGEVEELLIEKQLDTRDVIEIDVIITAQQELLEKSKKKDPEEFALDWLFKIEEWREQWARCYIIQNKTYQMFSKQRSESNHGSLKTFLGPTVLRRITLVDLATKIDEWENQVNMARSVDRMKRKVLNGKEKLLETAGLFDMISIHAYEVVVANSQTSLNKNHRVTETIE